MKKVLKILFLACGLFTLLASIYFGILAAYSFIGGSRLSSYENWSGFIVLALGMNAAFFCVLSAVFLFWFFLLKKLSREKIKEFSIIKKTFLIFSIILTLLIFIILIITVVLPNFKLKLEENSQDIKTKENFAILINALKSYSEKNNGLYPIENNFCTVGKNCSNFTELLSPYLTSFSINQDPGTVYYQSFDGSDCTIQTSLSTLNPNTRSYGYGYSCKLDRIVYDYYLFRGMHTYFECSAISGAGSVIGHPFGVCNLSKGSVFPQGWTKSQFYTKLSPEGY